MSLILAWFFMGIALGALFLWSQKRSVEQLNPDSGPAARKWILLGGISRWCLTAAFLAMAARDSATGALAGFIGLWLSRWVLLIRHVRLNPTGPQTSHPQREL